MLNIKNICGKFYFIFNFLLFSFCNFSIIPLLGTPVNLTKIVSLIFAQGVLVNIAPLHHNINSSKISNVPYYEKKSCSGQRINTIITLNK